MITNFLDVTENYKLNIKYQNHRYSYYMKAIDIHIFFLSYNLKDEARTDINMNKKNLQTQLENILKVSVSDIQNATQLKEYLNTAIYFKVAENLRLYNEIKYPSLFNSH